MKTLPILIAMLTISLMAITAQAADTTELKVTGSIRPSACTLDLGAAGTVDFGTILPKDLSTTSGTAIGTKSVNLTINCNQPAKLGIKMKDNRSSSVVSGLIGLVKKSQYAGSRAAFGLGIVDGKNVGVYSVDISSVNENGLAINQIGYQWGSRYDDGAAFFRGDDYYYFGGKSLSGPDSQTAVKTVSAKLNVQVVIDKLTNLPVAGSIPLDGSATVELIYM